MIPRILHQIWLGPNSLPDEFAAYGDSWRRNHPDWEYRLWTEDNLPNDLPLEVHQRLRAPAERSDLLRLELLARQGGVYVDTDFESLRPIDSLLANVRFFAAYYRRGRVNNAILGAEPGHAATLAALNEIRLRDSWGVVDKAGSGPLFLERVLKDRDDVTIFERPLFYPEAFERQQAVAYHHMARAWKDEQSLRRSVQIANERWRAARRELARVRHDGPAARAVLEVGEAARDGLAEGARKAGRAREELVAVASPALVRLRARAIARRRQISTRLPKMIHVVDLDESTPSLHRARLDSWRMAHPDWAVHVWTLDALPDDVHPAARDRLRSPWERADILLLELLARRGGVGVARDVACRHSAAPAAARFDAFAAVDADDRPSTAFFGTVAGGDAIAAALDAVLPTSWYALTDPGTGKEALAAAVPHGLALLSRGLSAIDSRSHSDIDWLRQRVVEAEARQHEAELELERALRR